MIGASATVQAVATIPGSMHKARQILSSCGEPGHSILLSPFRRSGTRSLSLDGTLVVSPVATGKTYQHHLA